MPGKVQTVSTHNMQHGQAANSIVVRLVVQTRVDSLLVCAIKVATRQMTGRQSRFAYMKLYRSA